MNSADVYLIIEYVIVSLVAAFALMAALWAVELIATNLLSPLLDKLLWGGYEAVMAALEAVGL